jgi:prolyl-tRNA synthetase
MAAAVEQHHDADGIIWPLALAPFEVALVSLNPAEETTRRAADEIYDALVLAGLEVLYDDRDERPGVKFKDADLLGFPIRVNVGGRSLKEGKVEVVLRRDKSLRTAARGEAVAAVRSAREELADESSKFKVQSSKLEPGQTVSVGRSRDKGSA